MPKFSNIPQMTRANYRINLPWSSLKDWIQRHKRLKLNLNPDFQRHHVWNDKQRIAYIEFILRGGISGKEIYFNCPGWMRTWEGPLELVDGKQRITAVLKFLDNKIPAFGYYYKEYEDDLPLEACFYINVNNLTSRKEILQWYIDLNSGVAHTPEELEKVKKLIEKEE